MAKITPENKILTKIGISKPGLQDSLKEYIAIWDTGATETFISSKVAKELELEIFGTGKMSDTNIESKNVNIYICNILIDGHSQSIKISTPEFRHRPECDVIVGINVIKHGKLLIENENFTFVIDKLL